MIYLDANATTAALDNVVSATMAMMRVPANPSSAHAAGAEARRALERARDDVCRLIGAADPDGIVFTSGGTEANNAVIRGALAASSDTLIVTSATEHASVAAPAALARSHVAVAVSGEGLVDPCAVAAALPPAGPPPLVAIGWANGETGVVQPVHAIAEAVRRRRPDAMILIDAAQALGRVPVDLGPCDVLTFSGHKLHGPPGIGALVLADPDDRRLPPLIEGGGQERGRRSGTPAVAAAAGLGIAFAERATTFGAAVAALADMRDRFEDAVLSRIPGARVNGGRSPRVPNTSNLLLPGIEAMTLVARLDQRGLCASVGSACSSARPGPSPTLLAMGLSEREAFASVRFSFSILNTVDEADAAAQLVAETVAELR